MNLEKTAKTVKGHAAVEDGKLSPRDMSAFLDRKEAEQIWKPTQLVCQPWTRVNFPMRSLEVARGMKEGQASPWQKCCDKVAEKLREGGQVILYGERWTGKTVMASKILWDFHNNCKMCRYERCLDLTLNLRRNYISEMGIDSEQLQRLYRRSHLLVIDEIGVKARGGEYSDFDQAQLTNLIDVRYAYGTAATLIISNEKPEEITRCLGPSIVRRIEETGLIVEAGWNSFKQK